MSMEDVMALSIPIVGIVAGVGAPLIVVSMVLRHQQRRMTRLHETVLALAGQGQPVPAALLDPPRSRRWSGHKTPLTLIGIGAGLAATCALIGDDALRFGAPLGVLPCAIGVAQLIALRLDRRDTARSDDAVVQ